MFVAFSLLFSFTSLHAQTITTDFTYDAVICGSANVNFSATVTGSYTLSDLLFTWDFGDGKPTKTGQTASNGFPVAPGAIHLVSPSPTEAPFQVKLTVTSRTTGAQLATVTKPVIVRPAPIPALLDAVNPLKPFDNCASNPTIQNPFYTVVVNNQSQDINLITGYKINWGDGTPVTSYVKTDFPISHQYNKLGLFSLKFTATGVNGCDATTTYSVKNQGNPAIGISSGGNTTGCSPITFGFRVNRVSKNDPGTTYVWDFGDGTTRNWTTDSINMNDSIVYHTYTLSSCNKANGYYNVKITATNGCQSTEASVGGVRVGARPIPNFSADNLCEGEAVNFTNTTITGSNFDCSLGVLYKWDFGDGSPIVITTNGGVYPHTFPTTSNVYTVKLTAINDCKDSISYSQTITITKRPVGNATLSPLSGCNPLTVNATDASTGDITSRTWSVFPTTGWSFGPGKNANSVNPQFIFNTKGNYVVTLQVRNQCTTNTKTFNIFVNGPINVSFPTIPNQCNTYVFDATMTSMFSLITIPNEVVQASWQVSPATGYTYLNGTNSQSLYPQIRFDSEGDYTLAVRLKNGCDSLTINRGFKFAFSPEAKATPSITDICIPDTVHFTNQSTGYQGVSTWTVTPAAGAAFVNGTSATSANPDIRFSQAGNYTVKLSVTNSCGTNTTSFTIRAKDKPTVTLQPIANICERGNLTISSSLLTVTTNNGGTLNYNWMVSPNTGFTYQNATSSTSANPSYQFNVSGTYTISVMVTNDCGSITKTQTFDVRPNGQIITAISDSTGCAPKTISFTDSSTGDNLTHKWTVSPSTGFSYVSGTSTSASPSMQFTQAGIYTITHTLSGLCSIQTKTFTVDIATIPSLTLAPIANQCAMPFDLIIDSTKFSINQNGKTLSNIRWWVKPDSIATFIDGTGPNSKYPHIRFNKTGPYTLWVETQNDCGNAVASRPFWVLAHAAEKTTHTPLTGCLPYKVNFTDQSGGDLLVHKWTVSPATGWTMTPSTADPSPQIDFNTPGVYTVTHSVTNLCGTDVRSYSIKVKDAPSVTLGLKPSSCNSYTYSANSINMRLIANLNDTISYQWSITPFRAITYLGGTSDTSHYPIIQFADTGVFYVKVRTLGECGFTETHQIINITKGPEIMLTPSLSSQCLPSDLTFTGTVWGQNLVYNWNVTPSPGVSYLNGTTAASPLPQIRFTRPGNYSVSLNVSNACSNDIKTWNYTIVDKPTIVFNKVADTCDNFTFRAERYIVVQDNGNAVSSYNWTITPSTGYSFVDGTSATSPLPHIQFTDANTYKLTMNATNACGTTPISQSFTLDKFVQVEAGADTTLCTVNTLYALTGTPAGGSWSIMPVAASGILKLIGSSYYLDLSVPGNYTLTYTRGNSYCASQDIRRFNILSLPTVDAGKDFTLCETDKNPYPLIGTPAGGTWSGNGVTGTTFSTTSLTSGSYILKYTWTDPVTTCTNTDQLVARILPVPVTGFTVLPEECKDVPVLFTPNGTVGTIYNWDFGDGQTAISSGSINHTYRTGGTFTIRMNSADPNNCSISTTKKITVLDDITFPNVNVTPNKGCGPLSVTIGVDTTGTLGNGQSYNWNFANGQTSGVPFTTKTLTFNQGINDTTYTISLTVSNNCFSKTVNYPVMVNAMPHANFALPHSWECSPKIVSVKNLSQDRSASFHWDFGDGTTSTAYEPTHTFSTGKIATTFMIKLVASNQCGKDSITRPLLIKPNSIEAFMQMDKRTACPGETVTFTNFSSDTVQQIMNYYWDFGDGTISNTWNATHAYSAQGRYTIKLFVDNGCSYAEKTDTILIYAPLILTISSRDSVCVGENLSLEGKSTMGPLINTKWDFGDGTFGTGTVTNHLFTIAGWNSITFSAATVANMSHCTGLVVKRIYVKALPLLTQAKDIEGCSPVVLNLKASGIEPQLWNFGEDSTWTSSGKYVFTNNMTDNKPIRRRVSTMTENTMGCRSWSSFWVTIYPTPTAKIRLYSAGGSPESVFLTSLSTNSTACEWLFPDGSVSQGCDSVLAKFYNNGFYKIELKSSNQYGCVDTTTVMHETIIKGLFVPNAFQPSNRNNQVNNFKPVGIGLKSYYLGIYDTWGNMIWETTQLIDGRPAVGWDGNTPKAQNLPMDVYIWRIKAVFIDGTEWKGMKGRDGILRTEGTVTLIK